MDLTKISICIVKFWNSKKGRVKDAGNDWLWEELLCDHIGVNANSLKDSTYKVSHIFNVQSLGIAFDRDSNVTYNNLCSDFYYVSCHM